MDKSEKIRHIYGIVIGLAAIALGIALICVAADIYYSGAETGVMYTREIVGEKLTALAIPFAILIGAIICGVIFPVYDVRAKHKSEDGLRLLGKKMPTGGEGEEYVAAKRKYNEIRIIRYIVWGYALAIALTSAIVSLCYLLNAANFPNKDISKEMLNMVSVVLPIVVVTFISLIAAAVINSVLASKELTELKKLIKFGNGTPVGDTTPQAVKSMRGFFANDITVWVIRGIVFAVAVTFIIVGIFNGGANDVLVKAINICTECIGLG